MAIPGLTTPNIGLPIDNIVSSVVKQASQSPTAPLPPVPVNGGSESLLAIANNLAAQKAQQQNTLNQSISQLVQYFSLLLPSTLLGIPLGLPEGLGGGGGIPDPSAAVAQPGAVPLQALPDPAAVATPFAVPAAPGAVAAAPGAVVAAPTAPAVPPNVNTTTDPTQKARLDNVLSKLMTDPEGSKLLQTALAKGYTFSVGDPSVAGLKDASGQPVHDATTCPACQSVAQDGGVQVNGVTIPSQHKIIINPAAPDFEKTVIHELVHAASDGDGNSQKEEGRADQIGYEIAARITGKAPPGTAAQIFQAKIRNYPTLQATNGIDNTLAQLGIAIPNF